jgi:hypothetical protein
MISPAAQLKTLGGFISRVVFLQWSIGKLLGGAGDEK